MIFAVLDRLYNVYICLNMKTFWAIAYYLRFWVVCMMHAFSLHAELTTSNTVKWVAYNPSIYLVIMGLKCYHQNVSLTSVFYWCSSDIFRSTPGVRELFTILVQNRNSPAAWWRRGQTNLLRSRLLGILSVCHNFSSISYGLTIQISNEASTCLYEFGWFAR